MNLSNGIITRPQKVVIAGVEGVGKTTLAAGFPDPVFQDIEMGSSHLDVVRAPAVSSWRMLRDQTAEFEIDRHGRKTLVVDTADWAERLCIAHICAEKGIESLGGSNDYGQSYNLLMSEWGRYLDSLTRVANHMHVLLLAHVHLKKFELPEEAGAYDRYELKMEKKISAATKEWADMHLFANYKTIVVEEEGTNKARGGERVMYTSHAPTRDAKNRHDLPDELPLKYSAIAHCFDGVIQDQPTAAAGESTPEPQPAQQPAQQPASEPAPEPQPAPPVGQQTEQMPINLGPLRDLMARDGVSDHELQLAVANRGYYPADTPLENYDPQFVDGKLVSHWNAVYKIVETIRKDVAV